MVAVVQATERALLVPRPRSPEARSAPLKAAPLAAVDLAAIVPPAEEEELPAKATLLKSKVVHARSGGHDSELALRPSLGQSGRVEGMPASRHEGSRLQPRALTISAPLAQGLHRQLHSRHFLPSTVRFRRD